MSSGFGLPPPTRFSPIQYPILSTYLDSEPGTSMQIHTEPGETRGHENRQFRVTSFELFRDLLCTQCKRSRVWLPCSCFCGWPPRPCPSLHSLSFRRSSFLASVQPRKRCFCVTGNRVREMRALLRGTAADTAHTYTYRW